MTSENFIEVSLYNSDDIDKIYMLKYKVNGKLRLRIIGLLLEMLLKPTIFQIIPIKIPIREDESYPISNTFTVDRIIAYGISITADWIETIWSINVSADQVERRKQLDTQEVFKVMLNHNPEDFKRICPLCNGAGQIEISNGNYEFIVCCVKCGTCNGKGWLNE